MAVSTRVKGLNLIGFKTFRLPRKRKKQLKKRWNSPFLSFDWRVFIKLKEK